VDGHKSKRSLMRTFPPPQPTVVFSPLNRQK
jgi:hypothetical protein